MDTNETDELQMLADKLAACMEESVGEMMMSYADHYRDMSSPNGRTMVFRGMEKWGEQRHPGEHIQRAMMAVADDINLSEEVKKQIVRALARELLYGVVYASYLREEHDTARLCIADIYPETSLPAEVADLFGPRGWMLPPQLMCEMAKTSATCGRIFKILAYREVQDLYTETLDASTTSLADRVRKARLDALRMTSDELLHRWHSIDENDPLTVAGRRIVRDLTAQETLVAIKDVLTLRSAELRTAPFTQLYVSMEDVCGEEGGSFEGTHLCRVFDLVERHGEVDSLTLQGSFRFHSMEQVLASPTLRYIGQRISGLSNLRHLGVGANYTYISPRSGLRRRRSCISLWIDKLPTSLRSLNAEIDARAVDAFVSQAPSFASTLTKLVIPTGSLGDAACKLVAHFPALTSLALMNNNLSARCIDAIVQHLPRLTTLSLRGNGHVGADPANVLALSRLANLTHLDVTNCRVAVRTLCSLLRELPPCLETLEAEGWEGWDYVNVSPREVFADDGKDKTCQRNPSDSLRRLAVGIPRRPALRHLSCPSVDEEGVAVLRSLFLPTTTISLFVIHEVKVFCGTVCYTSLPSPLAPGEIVL